MKTILLAFFCLCFGAHAQLALNNAFYNQFVSPSRGIDYNYFMTENFEAPGYENVWTQAGSGGVINDQYNSPPAPLQGLYSLRIQNIGDNRRTTNAFSLTHSTVYGFGMVYFPNLPNNREFFGIWNAGTQLMSVGVLGTTGSLYVEDAGGFRTSVPNSLSLNTLYFVWFRYTKGTGANATYEVQFSTSTTKPAGGNDTLTYTTGTSTLDANRFVIGATGGAASFQIITDKIRLSDTEIGSSPE